MTVRLFPVYLGYPIYYVDSVGGDDGNGGWYGLCNGWRLQNWRITQ